MFMDMTNDVKQWLAMQIKMTKKSKLTKSQLIAEMIDSAYGDVDGWDAIKKVHNILHTPAKYFVNDAVGDYYQNDGWLSVNAFKKRHYGVKHAHITLNGKVLPDV